MNKAICNELFGNRSFSESIKTIKSSGFSGVELAPHTIFGDFSGNLSAPLAEVRRVLNGEGVSFAGLHWLLVGPEGLHVTAADEKLRMRSWDHIRRLADMAGELGGGPLTLGSPSQRAGRDGMDSSEALKLFIKGLESVADDVDASGCRLLVEALPSEFTDVVNTLEEARSVIDGINRPGIGGMFDFHNTDDETDDWPALIRAHASHIFHVHINDKGGAAPTVMRPEFKNSFTALKEIGYKDWISLEIFTEPENPAALLKQVNEFLNEAER